MELARDTARMSYQSDKLAVDTREAARLLSVSPRTIQNYIRAKMFSPPARKIGRRTVIPVRALENFLRQDQPSPITGPAKVNHASFQHSGIRSLEFT